MAEVFAVGPSLLGFHQQVSPRLIGMVVGRSAHHMLVASTHNKQVAILYAGDKTHTLIA